MCLFINLSIKGSCPNTNVRPVLPTQNWENPFLYGAGLMQEGIVIVKQERGLLKTSTTNLGEHDLPKYRCML